MHDSLAALDCEPSEKVVSMRKLLGVFFAACVLGGAALGLGFSLARHTQPAARIPAESAQPAAADAYAVAPKPAPGTAEETPPGGEEIVIPTSPKSLVKETPPDVGAPAAAASGRMMVQVAAVSHPADANALVAALQRKGYAAAAVSGADHLVHVQVGPFATTQQARAVQARLADDGYAAILK